MLGVKKILTKFFVFACTFLFVFTFSFRENHADSFYDNKIKVNLKKDGSADIENVMDYKQTKGSEYYIPIDNLSKSNIINYRVSEIVDGKEFLYSEVENWNVKASLNEKKNKYGIVKKKNGVELCFGVGEYERKTFIIRYTITNFIKNLNDSDMLFWKFINDNLNEGPKSVNIIISKEDSKFTHENSKIWAFGSKGKIEFVDGNIIFKSLEKIRKNNYVTILSKIDKGYFTSGEKINRDFLYFKEKAFKGSDYKKNKKTNFRKFLKYIYGFIFFIATFFLANKSKRKRFKNGFKKGDLKGEYYRSVPEKDFHKLSYILECQGFEGTKSVIRAYFLKWILEKLLLPITQEKGVFIFKKEVISLKINQKKDYDFKDTIESTLFSMVIKAARDDYILQENEFKSYLRSERNQRLFENLTDEMDDLSVEYAKENNLLEKNKNGKFTYTYNEKGREFTKKLIQYYNYLKDFTLLSEREITQIKVWKELLIYASLFDVAEVVEKQLKKLSPDVLESFDVDIYSMHTAMIYSHVFSTNFIDAYTDNVESASDGLGGFTSIGGGGGSFGGGSGGGSR